MKISPILTQLRAQCPSLTGHIATGVDLALLQGNPNLPTPSAHVLPLADLASASTAQNSASQPIRDRFEIILALDATDATKALDLLHDLRAELWRALVDGKGN